MITICRKAFFYEQLKIEKSSFFEVPIRQDDGKLFKYECTINGDSIVWRGVDLFRQGEGPGRWRTEDAKALSSI